MHKNLHKMQDINKQLYHTKKISVYSNFKNKTQNGIFWPNFD